MQIIRNWLIICAFLVVAMVILGGYTRLSESGLSIVQWKPITGVLYPQTENAWQQEFELYKSSPEFLVKNFAMSLEQFKSIYIVEWAHRLLARVLGIIFIVPFLYFLLEKRLNGNVTRNLLVILMLGSLQGFVGWYMVESGLVNRPEVSQYRLALHLDIALAIYGFMLWQIFRLSDFTKRPVQYGYLGYYLIFLVVLQITSGAFVAGLDAGFIYNTYPYMGVGFIPDDLFYLTPWYMNFSENLVTVQFSHRMLALVILIFATIWSIVLYKQGLRKLALIIIAAISLQFLLGVLTLIYIVPVALGVLHQLGAIVLFTILLFVQNLLESRA